uniref:Uncharacterized protein n=1 Tax=Alexandrium andersonii TaxID=327968 RepID=A0A7S2NJY2_9DINO|mmetsp:Transcript_98135/g.219875  ORF Transcript_98135/g.219875 Transcript_98135/m.219875 type:complete len:932 (+) Transcript_98135:84-2879(+)
MSDLERPLVEPDAEAQEKSLVGKTDEEKHEEKSKPQSSAFWTKFSLACSMAGWVTLFYVPIVVPGVHQWFFVDTDAPHFLGSLDFESYWPNTVQLIVFTVYFSTGSTVNLAWQGLCGTVMAGINQVFMAHLFPHGGKCVKIAEYTGSGLRGHCEEFLDPNYGRWEWFVWFDVIFFIFLVLSSNAKENTMKFSMSWHVTYMMAFMSYDGYQASHAVNITSVIGCSLAILITLTPTFGVAGLTIKKQMCAKNLEGHPESIAEKMKEISEATVDFMLAKRPETAEERYQYKVDKAAIQMNVKELSGMAAAMTSDWSTSWWEGWVHLLTGCESGVKEFRQVRAHCGTFSEAFQDDIGGFDDIACVMKKVASAVDAASYNFVEAQDIDDIKKTRVELDPKIKVLNEASMNLLEYISSWKNMKAVIDNHDKPGEELGKQVGGRVSDVEDKFKDLFHGYKSWSEKNGVDGLSRGRKILRSNMSVFVFGILQLSMEVVDLSKKVVEKYKNNAQLRKDPDPAGLFKETATGMWDQFVATWMSDKTNPASLFVIKAFTDNDKRGFVLRNVISIGLCFILGNVLQGNVFKTPFNPLLAGTLAVLVSHFPGSAFYKNLMRLLGLAIGNALPIIMMAVTTLSGNFLRPYVHLLAFFTFELFFGLMYYTSPEWGYVGCIVAGFGCYSFTTDTWSDASFEAAYCKIGQVTAAIVIQIIVDSVDANITKKFPQTIVVENMKKLTDQNDGIVAVFDDLKIHMSEGTGKESMDKIKEKAKKLKDIVASQEAMVGECETKTTIVAGPSPAFQLDLYKGSLAAIEEMLGEIDVLCLLDEFTDNLTHEDRKISNVRAKWFTPEYVRFYGDVTSAMTKTFKTLNEILAKTDESLLRPDGRMCVLDEDTSPYTDSMRMAVVKRILADTIDHVLTIEHLFCESGCLEFKNPKKNR